VLSFLIPAYDAADVVGDAIRSALAQELDVESEVVVVDDGSSDSTGELVRSLAGDSDGRVRLVTHEQNRGGGAARNTAAGAARGDLLYMLDSDNILPPGCVAPQLRLQRETGLDAVSVAQLHYFDDDPRSVVDGWVLPHADGRSGVRHLFATSRVPGAHGNYLFTRRLFDAVGGYDEDVAAMDAWVFGMKHVVHGFEFGVLPSGYYLHRRKRAGRETYWAREERRGSNDANAIRALRRQADHLPPDLRELVGGLRDGDPLFALIERGAFTSPKRLARARRAVRVDRLARSARAAVAARRGTPVS
jgi:glycosyltransferase involved in cell wall biosynthesis